VKKLKKKYELSKGEVIEKWAKNYPKVMTWLAKLQKKENSAWFLWHYCRTINKTPDDLLTLKSDSRSRDAEYLLDTFVADTSLSFPHSIKLNIVVAVKSFYKHNYLDLAKASGAISFIKQKPYRKHTKEELLKIYRSAQSPRDRALITFVFSTAIAKESLRKIQWVHLDDDWEKQEIPHIGLPDVLIKGHGIGRYRGTEQHTFLTPEAKKDLIDYKDWLERVKGLKITVEDKIFVQVDQPYSGLNDNALTKIATVLSERSGVPFSWHDARRYVETSLEETKINPNWARKIRGRKVKGEEAPYSRPAIEQLRQAYKEAVPLLQFTQPTQLMELQKRQQEVERIQDKIIHGEPLTDDDRASMKLHDIRLREIKHRRTQTNGGETDCDFEQISETQLLSYLKAGWQIVHKLEDGQLIVKR